MSRKILNLCRLLTLTEVINHLLLEKHKTKETPLEVKAFPAKWIPFLHRHSWTGEDARQPCSWNSLCGGLNVSYFSGELLTLKLSCQIILKSVFKKTQMKIKSQEGFFMEYFIKCTWVGRKCLLITVLDPFSGLRSNEAGWGRRSVFRAHSLTYAAWLGL